ncbi:MAG: hypothetical protein IPL49_20530 [Saprospirales bacterium]|nr:hypothetical protein [Saprospirales bacterium]MBK8493201.1 hypothetical protein [Saprospirales bacterium]
MGLSSFQIEPVFVPSLFVEIRKRLGQKGNAELNDLMIRQARDLKAILIDRLYGSHLELWKKKPRTYRREAQRAFVSFSKKKRRDKKDIRKATGQQLRYLRRNLPAGRQV